MSKRLSATLLTLALATGVELVAPSRLLAQTRVSTLEELRNILSPGDDISIIDKDGQRVRGRLLWFGDADIAIRTEAVVTERESRPRDITLPSSAIQSLERRPDSTSNGTFIGAGVGAGFALTAFAVAAAKDRNEIDEYAMGYLAFGTVTTGIGALVGWAIDRVHSKPHVRFYALTEGKLRISAAPSFSHGSKGLVFVLSF